MATPSHAQQPTPERFFNAVNAYQITAAIKAAVELDVFTAIADGNVSAAALARRCNVAERGARILCDFLVIHGFLTKDRTRIWPGAGFRDFPRPDIACLQRRDR